MTLVVLTIVFCVLSSLQLILVYGRKCDTFETCVCSEIILDSTPHLVVNCSFKSLTKIPIGLPYDRHVYDFTGNQLNIVEMMNIFLLMMVDAVVKIFIFDGNPLPSLPGIPPSTDPKIEFVSFKECQVAEINENTFNGLFRIHTLHLEFNKIQLLPEKIFRTLPALRHLFMDKNELTTIPSGLFETNTQLEEISFQNNKLTFLPDNVFVPISVIDSLNLGNNELYEFNESIFRENQQILQLTYAPNPLTCDCSIKGLYSLAHRLNNDFGGNVTANCLYLNGSGHLSIYDIDSSLFVNCENEDFTTLPQDEETEKRKSGITALPEEETHKSNTAMIIMVSTFAIIGTVAVGVSLYVALNNTKRATQKNSQGRQSNTAGSTLCEGCFNQCLNCLNGEEKVKVGPLKERNCRENGKHEKDEDEDIEKTSEDSGGHDISLKKV